MTDATETQTNDATTVAEASGPVVYENERDFIEAYFNGDDNTAGTWMSYSFAGPNLFYGSNLVAVYNSGYAGISNRGNMTDGVNDLVLYFAGRHGLRFGRLPELSSNSYRRDDFQRRTFDRVEVAASIFGLDFDIEEFKRLDSERKAIDTRLDEMQNVIVNGTDNYVAAIAERREAVTAAKNNAQFDAGGCYDEPVRGEGGDFRLRLSPTGTVGSSGGYTISRGRFDMAFDKVAPYVYGPKGEEVKDSSNQIDLGYVGDNIVYYYPKSYYGNTEKVGIGCQVITVAELTRFAKVLGYPTDGRAHDADKVDTAPEAE